jgi:hypothetical protein
MKSFYLNLLKDCRNDVRRDAHFFILQNLLIYIYIFFLHIGNVLNNNNNNNYFKLVVRYP